jgi:hypothetical protein
MMIHSTGTPFNSASNNNLKHPVQPELEPITKMLHSLFIMGVEIPLGDGGPRTPKKERFSSNILTDYDIRLMQKIAVAIDLNQPILIEGGSGLGKSETTERLGAMLNREIYYANCHDFTPDVLIGGMKVVNDTETGFGWLDGVVMQAIRNGGLLFLDEYNFMNGETRGRLHEVLDAVLNHKSTVSLVENNSEQVPVHPNFRLIAAQNPPGFPFADRELLDPAQLSRFFYCKEPTDIPNSLKRHRILGMLARSEPSQIGDCEYLSSSKSLTREMLRSNNDLGKKLATAFIEFHGSITEAITRGDLGSRQAQPLHLVYPRDLKRTFSFFLQYHNGNSFASMQRAMEFYFGNLFESKADKSAVKALAIKSLIKAGLQ